MAKSNPSLADLSRMRKEARKAKRGGLGDSPHEPSLQEAVTQVASVEAIEQQRLEPQPHVARQSNKPKTAQKPYVEKTKPVEIEEQVSLVQSDRQSETSDDLKLKIVTKQKPIELEEQKKVGRPKGIRSNPDYESTTIRLHKQVKAKARYILSTQAEKMDLQTLLNNLLEDFVREQEAK